MPELSFSGQFGFVGVTESDVVAESNVFGILGVEARVAGLAAGLALDYNFEENSLTTRGLLGAYFYAPVDITVDFDEPLSSMFSVTDIDTGLTAGIGGRFTVGGLSAGAVASISLGALSGVTVEGAADFGPYKGLNPALKAPRHSIRRIPNGIFVWS